MNIIKDGTTADVPAQDAHEHHQDHTHTYTHDHEQGQGSHGQVQQHPRQRDFPMQPQRRTREQLTHIQGWGADLDHKNRPAVPMERMPARYTEASPGQPEQQLETVEILVSPERPGITPLFSSAQPPSGLSGMIRRLAFKTTENDIRHWLLLLAADRVNMVEGIGQDLMRGKVPNVLSEMGIKAELKHNPAGLAKKALITSALVGGAWYLLKRRRER